METIKWEDFEKVELRIGTIVQVEDFPEARKPAYKIWVDFGAELGIKKTSAQVTTLYSKEDLQGRQIIGVVNFEPKQVGGFMSEFLLTGFANEQGDIVIATSDSAIPNGRKLI